MKTALVALFVFASTTASAGELTCKVTETISPPLEARSTAYEVHAPLNGRVDLESKTLNLDLHIVTFLSTLTSPGKQVVIIDVQDKNSGANTSANGHDQAKLQYSVAGGTLSVHCAAQ